MAICKFCNQDMLKFDNCPVNDFVEFPSGEKLPAIPYTNEYIKGKHQCHDCGVSVGNYHHPGCDMEICPQCGGQLISCGCLDEEVEEY